MRMLTANTAICVCAPNLTPNLCSKARGEEESMGQRVRTGLGPTWTCPNFPATPQGHTRPRAHSCLFSPRDNTTATQLSSALFLAAPICAPCCSQRDLSKVFLSRSETLPWFSMTIQFIALMGILVRVKESAIN